MLFKAIVLSLNRIIPYCKLFHLILVPCTWLLDVLDPHSPVIFLDTDDLPAPETRSGRNVYNEKEAAVVASIAHALVQSGLDADSIGVISPYRHQLKVIKQHVDMETGNYEYVVLFYCNACC